MFSCSLCGGLSLFSNLIFDFSSFLEWCNMHVLCGEAGDVCMGEESFYSSEERFTAVYVYIPAEFAV